MATGDTIRIGGQVVGHEGDNSPVDQALRRERLADQPTQVLPPAMPGSTWDQLRAYTQPTPAQPAPAPAPPAGTPAPKKVKKAAAPSADKEAPGTGGKGDSEPPPPPSRFRRISSAARGLLPEGLVSRVSNAPTPGGLTPLVIALLFLLFAVVPVGVGGRTRLELIWAALTGGVDLPKSPARQQKEAGQVEAAAKSAAEGGVLQVIDPALGSAILDGLWGAL